jgi:class 3 adenylate cyclase
LPRIIIDLPLRRQPRDHGRRQIRCIFAQEGGQCLLKVAGRHPAQIENWQQGVEALRPPRPLRQDRRGEADFLIPLHVSAVAHLGTPNLDRPNPSLDGALRSMTVTHDAVAAIRQLQVLPLRDEGIGFSNQHPGQHPTNAFTCDFAQWIIDSIRLTERDDGGISRHGVSLLSGGSGRLDTRLDTPPSAFSEVSEPEEVILVLREYHTALGILVDKFEGTVERFTGDGLLVIFKDPLPCPDPSIRAVQMAVEMRDEVTKLSVKWSRSGHDIGFGIGIAHGYATLGTVGYEGQFQYSVTGKVANLASRLCNEAKNGQILIDINVFSAVETRADAEFTEELILKGFSRPVKAFNVRNWLPSR